MGLKDKLSEIKGDLEVFQKQDIKIEVGIVKPAFRSHYLEIIATGVSDDISLGADIQRVLRTQVGYGRVDSKYNEEARTLTIDYYPLKRENPISTSSTIDANPAPVAGANRDYK